MNKESVVELLKDLADYGEKGKVAEPSMVLRARDSIAALEAQVVVPENWKLVPVEPTRQMLNAGVNAGVSASPEPWCPAAYRAMLNAAPTPAEKMYAVQSVTGVHIGLWSDHRTAVEVQAEHPESKIIELAVIDSAPSPTEKVKCPRCKDSGRYLVGPIDCAALRICSCQSAPAAPGNGEGEADG